RVRGTGRRAVVRPGDGGGRRRVPLVVCGSVRGYAGAEPPRLMSVTVRLAAPLRAAAGGNATLSIDAPDLATLTREIADRYPELAARVLRDGEFGRFVNVFIDGEDVRFFAADGALKGKRTVEILPAMSGGAVAPLPEQKARREHAVLGYVNDHASRHAVRGTHVLPTLQTA